MPKKSRDFPEQINLLAPEGTQIMLRAIAFYRGDGGQYAAVARDFIARGLREWVADLSDRDRKRFEEILANVRLTRTSQG